MTVIGHLGREFYYLLTAHAQGVIVKLFSVSKMQVRKALVATWDVIK